MSNEPKLMETAIGAVEGAGMAPDRPSRRPLLVASAAAYVLLAVALPVSLNAYDGAVTLGLHTALADDGGEGGGGGEGGAGGEGDGGDDGSNGDDPGGDDDGGPDDDDGGPDEGDESNNDIDGDEDEDEFSGDAAVTGPVLP